ncbi:MAG: TatD family hydrolase [Candidatus Riflebacteria bacterium]|nr:TatD family hydrolase [Candidatus Riflebacteria bacterium]
MITCPLTDVHAHLQDGKFSEDLEEVVRRAAEAGITRIINAGTSIEDSHRAIEIARKFPVCRSLVGIHPHDASTFNENSLNELKEMASDPCVIGIGEIGLDFHYDLSPRETQISVFRQLWLLAAELNLPAVIHVREAYDAFFTAIQGLSCPPKVLLHCFSGDLNIARQAVDNGFHFSIGGALTFPKSELTREVFKHLPEDRIHLETDCPYLAPQFKRGKRNEPAFMTATLEQLARLRKLPTVAMAEILKQNNISFFGPEAG